MRSTDECEMSRSCHSATSSSAGVTAERTMRASPVRFSVNTGLRLCGMADEPFWPSEKNSSASMHFGALQMPDFGREPLDRRGDDAERRKESRMAIARDHLRRNRLGFQVQFRRHISLDPRVDVGESADRAGNRAGRDLLARRDKPGAGPGKFRVGEGQLEAEGGGLGVDSVRAADGRRHLMFEGATLERREQRVDVGDEDVARAAELHGEAGVEHVGAGQPQMDEARFGADEFGEVSEEGDDVVLRHPLDLVDPRHVELGLVAPSPRSPWPPLSGSRRSRPSLREA